MEEKILCAGFGGQGVMSLGQLLAYAGMLEGKHVTWMPSYGPEMRGGTAYCSVVISSRPVGSPIVTNGATSVIVMNLPSLKKFEKSLLPGGIILINSSLIEETVTRYDIHPYHIPVIDLAASCGCDRAANMVILGCYLGLTKIIEVNSVLAAMEKVFGKKDKDFFTINEQALILGEQLMAGASERQAAA